MSSTLGLALSALLALVGLWILLRRRPVLGAALVLVGIGLGASTFIELPGGGAGSWSSDQARREASFVLRADLQPRSDGAAAARLTRAWIDLDGVSGTRGDAGKHVWVYGSPNATVMQMDAALEAMESESTVVSVVRER